jgi:hypothetical protein
MNKIIFFLSFIAFACNSNPKTDDALPLENPEERSMETYLEKGQEISMATFKVLSSTLSEKMQEEGIVGAIEFCNLSALPITDSLSDVFDAKIKRAALNYRNPANKLSVEEEEIYQNFLKQIESGAEKINPIVKLKKDGGAFFYSPIKLMPQCVTCHGKVGEQISSETLAIINNKYPEDKAVNFEIGSLRGIWAIEF